MFSLLLNLSLIGEFVMGAISNYLKYPATLLHSQGCNPTKFPDGAVAFLCSHCSRKFGICGSLAVSTCWLKWRSILFNELVPFFDSYHSFFIIYKIFITGRDAFNFPTLRFYKSFDV